ncbi:MAG TPA: hypothetical protein VM098_00935 [Phycisphaerae bacterium]|nr:hypothetical protein [Phycisphaerae bacterium]
MKQKSTSPRRGPDRRARSGALTACLLAALVGRAGAAQPINLPHPLSEMAREVQASRAQVLLIQKRLAAKSAALKKWRKDNEGRLKQLRAVKREAEKTLRAVKDRLEKAGIKSPERLKDPTYKKALEAVRKCTDRRQGLREREKALVEAEDAKVLAVFTPLQRALWEAVQIAKPYRRQPRKQHALTDRQLDEIDILCEAAAGELTAVATQPAARAARARNEVLYRLQVSIYEDVLDDDQRPHAPKPKAPPKKKK